ncbi:MAG: hypothetical protein AMR96_04230 [Candidatus Adiutrix intracellularis]|jgi:broad specificity phosphatase PhoE|nr:MAG: hypothetical protein AMR96_04230 [Candidatus Adiutrix intracellularis]MDR2827300.1 histidine phosphatase family protein [Candidatus Adiutrix intracellularis]
MTKLHPIRLFFIRHGQTENFDHPPLNGWRDAPLTEIGRRQLDQIVEAFTSVPFEAVYSSDLSRAVYGGRKLAEARGLKLWSDPKWREINFGQWEGLTYTQIMDLDRNYFHKIFSPNGGGVNLSFPGGGESTVSFARRIEESLTDLKCRHPNGGRVALVAHGGVCKMLWGLILKIPPEVAWFVIRQDFAAVNVADIYPNDRYVAHLVNGYVGPEGYYRVGLGFNRLLGEDVFK